MAKGKVSQGDIRVARIITKESGKYLILGKVIDHPVLGEIETQALLRAGKELKVSEGDYINSTDVADLNLAWR